MNNSKHRIAKSIVRIIYIALIFFSSACILATQIFDFIFDKTSDDI